MANQPSKSVPSYEKSHPDYNGLDSDSDDDGVSKETFNSVELADHDRQLLLEEDEREELLTSGRPVGRRSFFDGSEDKSLDREQWISRQRSHKARRRKKGKNNDQGELLYKMESGDVKDDSSSQASSSSTELDQLPSKGASIRRRLLLHTGVGVAIAGFFLFLVFGSYRASQYPKAALKLGTLSNGTRDFAPTTILISLDGFRADFLHRGLTPTLNTFVAEGVSPEWMLPSFPSVTFPNHYTLVTGLHPESHGVVGNTFWDPELKEDFYYTDPTRSMQPKWWAGGEPLWVTAEKQNVTTAIHMWPGSEAHIAHLEPTHLDKFNGSEDLTRKVDRVLELLDLPGGVDSDTNIAASTARPQLIAAYVPVVDADGHTYGPNSTEIRDTIKRVDRMLADLFTGISQRNLTMIVNVVVVSDHGMATTSTDRLIQLDDLIDLDLVDRIDGWPLYGLRPKNPADLQGLYDRLLVEANDNDNIDVYVKETMPERYHFSNNDRIAPLWVIPRAGWAIVHKEDFDVKAAKAKGEVYHPKGLHGYDHEHPLMRSIFIARGPAFPHQPNSRLDVFQNIEVYNIVCDSLGIEPKPNNGTLRLPLKPIGVHSSHSASEWDLPEDLPSDPAIPGTAPSASSSLKDESSKSVYQTDNAEGMGTNSKDGESYWAFVSAKLQAAKEWADEKIAKLALLDFPTPLGLRLHISSLSTPQFASSYTLASTGLLSGSLSYLYTSLPLPLLPSATRSLPLPSFTPTSYRQLLPLRPPDPAWWWEIWQAGRRIDTRDALLYGRLYLPKSTLEALYLRRLSPTTQVKISAVSDSRLPNGGSVLALLAQDRAKWSAEYMYSTDSALLGVRGLYNFGPDPRETGAGTVPLAVQEVAAMVPDSVEIRGGLRKGNSVAEQVGRFSAGAEVYYGLLNKSGGMSTGVRFTTLPAHAGFPYTMTVTLNPLMGNLSSSYSVKAGELLSLSSRFDFNVYSYESEVVMGMELWKLTEMGGRDEGVIREEKGNVDGIEGKIGMKSIDEEKKKINGDVAGCLKARMDQRGSVGLLWEGRVKELVYSCGASIDLRGGKEMIRGVGLEVQYSS
ncbi:MAG: hypothetical protein Q9223_004627 [Gallowayella weberi]